MTFKSAKAYSLNFIFKNFHLPPGIYIVRALIGDETLTEKINLK